MILIKVHLFPNFVTPTNFIVASCFASRWVVQTHTKRRDTNRDTRFFFIVATQIVTWRLTRVAPSVAPSIKRQASSHCSQSFKQSHLPTLFLLFASPMHPISSPRSIASSHFSLLSLPSLRFSFSLNSHAILINNLIYILGRSVPVPPFPQ